MYRVNEAELVAAVLALRSNQDVTAMVEAATRLWLARLERLDLNDDAEAAVWAAIVDAGAVCEAVKAGVTLLRAGERLRLAAFVHLSENIRGLRDHADGRDATLLVPRRLATEAVAALLELADIVIARGWVDEPYFAAIVARLEEGLAHRALAEYVRQHATKLAAHPTLWAAVALALTTTPAGTTAEVDAWFADWQGRARVPMWAIAMYVHHRRSLPAPPPLAELANHARAAREQLPADGTAPYLLIFELEAALAHGPEAWLPLLEANATLLAQPLPWLDHPVIIEVNRVKFDHPVRLHHFDTVPDPESSRGQWTGALSLPGALIAAAEGPRANQTLLMAVRDQFTNPLGLLLLRDLARLPEGVSAEAEALAVFRAGAQAKLPFRLATFNRERERLLNRRIGLLAKVKRWFV